MKPVTLFSLPYAGGSAAIYRGWPNRMPDWVQLVPLHLPGRGVRSRMSPMFEWTPLLNLLAQDVRPYLDQPFAIFGHSMGALVGIELAFELRARFQVSPVWMGVSACIAPSKRERELKWLECPHSELMEEVVSLNGTAADLLGNDELMALAAPVLRADFHLCGTHTYRRVPPLACPMLVLGGENDDEIMEDSENLAAWAQEVSGPFEIQMLKADHFFINTHQDEVISKITTSLARHFRLQLPARSARRIGA